MEKSKKIDLNLEPEISSRNPKRILRHCEKFQDENGGEKLNPLSLVAAVHMKPLTIGERLARFSRAPVLDPSYGYDELDDGIDEVIDPMSPYEDRAHALVRKASKKKAARQKIFDAERAEKERENIARLSKQLEDLRTQAADLPPTPPPAKKSKG